MSVQISVIIPTYNHENYIERAVNSVLEQKVNFEIEVFIGEDCSTDKTRTVLKGMEDRLPEYFHIYYREKNLNAGNFDDLYSRMTGKYFIMLEGDDYWTYEYKLQREYDFLETHPDYVAVAHNAQVVNEKGVPVNWHIHECKKSEYTIKDFQKGLFPGQTATVLRRNYYYYDLFDYDIRAPKNYPGDRVKAFLMAANGKVYCFQEKWSAYRLVTTHVSSFAANSSYDYQSKLEYHAALYDYAKRNKNTSVLKVIEQMYFWYFWGCIMKKKCGLHFEDFREEFSNAEFRMSILLYIIKKMFLLPFSKVSVMIEAYRRNKAIEKSFQGMGR